MLYIYMYIYIYVYIYIHSGKKETKKLQLSSDSEFHVQFSIINFQNALIKTISIDRWIDR